MEDKVISFGKGIHREPSVGAVGELSDCVNLYSKNGEMRMLPVLAEVEDAAKFDSDLLEVKFIHKPNNERHIIVQYNGSAEGYDWVAVSDWGTLTAGDVIKYTKDGIEHEESVYSVQPNVAGGWNVYINSTTMIYSGNGISLYKKTAKSGKNNSIAWCDFTGNKINASNLSIIVVLGSEEKLNDITGIGNVLVIATSVKMYYYIWVDGSYKDYTFDGLEDLDIQFALEGNVVIKSGAQVKVAQDLFSGDALFTEYVYSKDNRNIFELSDETSQEFTNIPTYYFGSSNPKQNTRLKGICLEFEDFDPLEEYQIELQNMHEDKSTACFIAIKYKNYERYAFGRIGGYGKQPFMTTFNRFDDYKHEYDYDITNLGGIEKIIFAKSYAYDNDNMRDSNYDSLISIYKKPEGFGGNGQSLEHTSENISAFLGGIDEFIAEQSVNENRFMYPFFVRYALKLRDGSIIKPSSPILMLPSTSEAPNVYVATGGARPTISAVCAKLQYMICNRSTVITNLRNKSQLIKSIVIAVTKPIYTYKSAPTETDLLKSLICTNTEIDSFSNVKIDSLSDEYKCYDKKTLDRDKYKLSGVRIILPYYDDDEKIKLYENAAETFHIISEIEIDSLSNTDGNSFKDVPLDYGTLAGLNGLSLLNDNSVSLKTFIADNLYSYNSRLILGNINEKLFKGYAPQIMTGYISPKTTSQYNRHIAAEIEITKNSQTYKVRKNCSYDNESGIIFFYYPDADAKTVTLYKENINKSGANIEVRSVSLKKHPHLNGAYWFGNFEELPITRQTEYKWDDYPDLSSSYTNGNKIIASLVNNPFVIDSNTASLVGTGEVQRLIANTKALSQGQFGQHPVLAFCTDGIWALSIGSEGAFNAVQPITRDVANNPNNIAQLDSALVFATEGGLMMLDGSNVRRLDAQMDNKRDFALSNISSLNVLSGGGIDVVQSDGRTWKDVINNSKLSYDYVHKLLWLHNTTGKDKTGNVFTSLVSYVIDLNNGEIYQHVQGDNFSKAVAVLNDYPVNYLQLSQYQGIDTTLHEAKFKDILTTYDNDDEVVKEGWFITRPIAFDNAYTMKMLYDMKVEKYLCTDSSSSSKSVKVAVFVSNDRTQWTRLTSLKARSFKWYRFAVFCKMNDYDRLTGLICRIDERRTNKLR